MGRLLLVSGGVASSDTGCGYASRGMGGACSIGHGVTNDVVEILYIDGMMNLER